MLISYYKTVIILHTYINYCTLYHEPWIILNHLRQKLTLLEAKNMHIQCTRTVKPLYSGPSVKQPPHELQVLQPATEVTCDTCIMAYMYIYTHCMHLITQPPLHCSYKFMLIEDYYICIEVSLCNVFMFIAYGSTGICDLTNYMYMYIELRTNSLGHEQPSCLDVKQSPNGKYMYMRTCLCDGTIHTLSVEQVTA